MRAGTVRLGVVTSDECGMQTVTYEREGSRWQGQLHLPGSHLLADVGDRVRLTWTGGHWKCEVLGRAWPKALALPDPAPSG